ncbi:hypothetical protein Nos7524_1208 [Nostoc sp. PCC 7524]|nr:hypothetical protein Nos7524_1208 [Nostoc sp. PCC 7524]
MLDSEIITLDYLLISRYLNRNWYLWHRVLGRCKVTNINRYDVNTVYVQFGNHQSVKCSLDFLGLKPKNSIIR